MSETNPKPYVTEKSSKLIELFNKYTFLISPSDNKVSIKQYFKTKYDVVATDVAVIKLPSKTRRRGRIVGKTKSKIKAVVSFKEGSDIEAIKKLF